MMDYTTSSSRPGSNNPGSNVGDGGGKAVRRTLLMNNSTQPFNIPASLLQNSNVNSNSSMNPSTYSADRKLYEQFNFFKEEFIKTAIKMDIAIPIDLVEEGKSSNLRFFLENNGPKYIFSVIQSHMNEVQIMRSGLSLMIITIALFKRHLPRALDAHHPFYYEGNRLGSPQPLTADELWATQVISKITDSVSVPGCVSILISTHNPVIQELVINLIAALISISDDCITQLLLVPNILYTQTNKKIPNVENNREKILHNQLRKIASRLSPNNSSSNLDTSGPLSNGHETRRNSASPNPAGENAGGNRHSFRFERSNSKQRAGTAGGKGENDYDNDDANANDPEEFQSCLSYIFSIVLMQKNRHLLLAGCADIIITMSKSSASSSLLCEFVAKVPTSPLPMIDFNKNENKNRGNLLKHLYTNQPQQSFEPLHVNPLGARILDWAGIRIPLKFLQRYHQIFGTSTTIVQGNRSKSVVAAPTNPNNSVVPSANASVSSSSESILNDNIKNEYRYAHNRALLAVCSLLVASHDIVVYVVSLQGAIEVIKLSAAIYSDDEMNQSRSGPTGSTAHHHHHDHFGSVGGGGIKGKNRLDLHHSNLPSVIVTALNALQLEKQHQHRLKAMLNHSLAVGGSLGSNSNSRRSSTTVPAAAALAVQQHQQQMNQQSTRNLKSRDASITNTSSSNPPSRSPEHSRFLANKLKPLTQQKGQSIDPSQKLLFQQPVKLQKTSNPSQQNLTQAIPLSSSIEMKFDGSFTKENEKYQLYLQNQNDAKIYQQSLASDLQYYAAKQISTQNKGPLQFYNLPNEDSLLNTSLQAIEQQTQENLLQPPKRQHVKSPVMFSNGGLEGSTSIYLESNSLSQSDTKLQISGDPSNENNGLTMKSAPTSPYHTTSGMSASRDFFGNLPSKPHLPQRIEPKDVIVKDESMSRIRKKFQLIAENAVKQIESSGKNCVGSRFLGCIIFTLLLFRYGNSEWEEPGND
jgi:hypothetical protein